MPNRINIGDRVVFVQHYLPEDPLSLLLDKEGDVLLMHENTAVVDFDHAAVTVDLADIEPLPAPNQAPEPGTDLIKLTDDHECSGMSRAQIISHKLLAQEEDPKLDHELTELLTTK